MARGSSGRMVFELDPLMKRELYAKLSMDGRTAKDWLVEQIERYLRTRQANLPFDEIAGGESAGTEHANP